MAASTSQSLFGTLKFPSLSPRPVPRSRLHPLTPDVKADQQVEKDGDSTYSSEVRGELSCGVCLERFQEPKVLPCCHSFCLKCLEGTLQRAKVKTNLTCPQCRTQHEVPENGPKGFLNDYTLISPKQEESVNTETCKQCDENNIAASFCKDCSEYYCESCLQAHKRLKLFQDHETVAVEDLSMEPTLMKGRTHKCSVHPNEAIKLYCESCQTLVCVHCFVESHNGHTMRSIDGKMRQEAQKEIKASSRKILSKLKTFRENLEYIQTVEKNKTEESEPLKAEINKKVDSMIARLEARRGQLLTEVDKIYSVGLEQLQGEREFHETSISSMEGALSFAGRVLDCSYDTELLVLSDQLIPQLKKLSQLEWDSESTEEFEMKKRLWRESTTVLCSKKYRMKVIAKIELVGRVYCPYSSCSSGETLNEIELTPHGVPTKATCGQTIEFQVVAKIPNHSRAEKFIKVEGKLKYKERQLSLLNSSLRYSFESSRTRVTASRINGKNIWKVTFTPEENGTCVVSLKVWAKYGGVTIGSGWTECATTPEILVASSEQQASNSTPLNTL